MTTFLFVTIPLIEQQFGGNEPYFYLIDIEKAILELADTANHVTTLFALLLYEINKT